MAKQKNKDFKDLYSKILVFMISIIVMSIPIIFLGLMFLGAVEQSLTFDDLNKYCKDRGFQGVENLGKKAWSKDTYVCYKVVPHVSGVGTETIYSGELK